MKKIIALLLLAVFFTLPVQASYESYVETAIADGIILGDENGNINADVPVTRGEFAVILTKFLNLSGGINTFLDVAPHDWFYEAMVAANHYSIIMGDEKGNARPYDNITRQDVVTILGRFFSAKSPVNTQTDRVSDYAAEYWSYAASNGLLTKYEPLEYATKGEILQLLYDYDTTDGTDIRFMNGYPRISQNCGTFNHITLEIRTNKPCDIYYSITEKDTPHGEFDALLCKTEKDIATVSFKANMSKSYDIYLLAVDENGITSKTAVIKDVEPFSIASGDGSVISPYIIYTPQQLSQISMLPEKHYRMGSDIVLTEEWNPLPDFYGILDGNGHAVKGLVTDNKNNAGLFGFLGGTVKNLTVYGDVSATKIAGIIAGENDGIIENCTVSGSVSAKTDHAGSICGINYGTISNCLATPYSVASGSYAGGIAGTNSGSIEKCLAAANVVASDMYAGGIAGINNGGKINSCVSACMTVHDVITKNSGRITTNKNGGMLNKNYFYLEAISEAMYEEPSDHSQNGYDASWSEMRDMSFYRRLGWSSQDWKLANNGFRLVYPKDSQAPQLTPGETIYFPKSIRTPQELRQIDSNEAGHYILSSDIHLSAPWKTICGTAGFSGTFDGDNHTIYNLNLNTQTGFFSNITGGTVKNLTLKNVTASTDSVGGILTACNYGYIDNCNIYGTIQTKKASHIGAFAGLNHGAITYCSAFVDIQNTYSNSTIGGICGESDGVIFGCTYRGKMNLSGENVVAGGICGYDTFGYVSDCFSDITVTANSDSGYLGGICGMAEGTQVYKCASDGSIVATSKETLYSGGICALAQDATLYNCFSIAEIHAFSDLGYIGGICGCNSGSNIQNTYSAGSILSGGDIYAGGICGYSEHGFIMQNVALNPAINGGINIGAIYGKSEMSGITDNYSCEKTLINSQHIVSHEKNGVIKSLDVLKNTDFYCKPIASGGLLGWPSAETGDDVWKNSGTGYIFPTLSDVKTFGVLASPTYR